MSNAGPGPMFGSRLAAYVIDALIVFGVQWLSVFILSRLAMLIGLGSEQVCGTANDGTEVMCQDLGLVWVLVIAILVVTTFGYYAWFDGVEGATPGKRRMGLGVVDHSAAQPTPAGETAGPAGAAGWPVIGLGRGIVRALVRQGIWVWALFFVAGMPTAVSVPPSVFFVAGLVALAPLAWAAFAGDGRGLADLAAGSAVLERAGSGAQAAVVPERVTPPVDPASADSDGPADKPADRGGESGAFRSQLRP